MFCFIIPPPQDKKEANSIVKICSFKIKQTNLAGYGLVTNDGVVDARKRLPYMDLKTLLQHHGLSTLACLQQEPADYALSEIDFLPVIVEPGKIICVGMNYADKREEFGETNPSPTLFVRFADSLAPHTGLLLKPDTTEQFDYEGELAVIIGRSAHHIPAGDALNYVAGYSCFMDATVRDMQFSWYTAGKNWPQTGGFGPWMTTTEEITDPQSLSVTTLLNGQVVQKDTTANMIHTVADIIAYVSSFTPLSPGDVIITGSPGGVGKSRVPPLFMFPGDRITVEISRIGELMNTVG